MAMIQKGKYPVPYIGITQYYSKAHPALDLGWDTPNPPISSALDGEVAVATTDTDGAKYVVIRHDNAIAGKRVYTLYWHLAAFYVGKGNKVFLSTPSMRRVTTYKAGSGIHGRNFYPHPPCGG